MEKPVVVYTQPRCRTCRQVKEFLSQKGVEYIERDVTIDDEAFAELERLGLLTTPVTLIGKEVVLGFDRSRFEALLSESGQIAR